MLMLHIYFEPPVNSSTMWGLHFPVLSRTLSFHFQDFPGPNWFSRTFQGLENPGKNPGLSGCVGTLVLLLQQRRNTKFTDSHHYVNTTVTHNHSSHSSVGSVFLTKESARKHPQLGHWIFILSHLTNACRKLCRKDKITRPYRARNMHHKQHQKHYNCHTAQRQNRWPLTPDHTNE